MSNIALMVWENVLKPFTESFKLLFHLVWELGSFEVDFLIRDHLSREHTHFASMGVHGNLLSSMESIIMEAI